MSILPLMPANSFLPLYSLYIPIYIICLSVCLEIVFCLEQVLSLLDHSASTAAGGTPWTNIKRTSLKRDNCKREFYCVKQMFPWKRGKILNRTSFYSKHYTKYWNPPLHVVCLHVDRDDVFAGLLLTAMQEDNFCRDSDRKGDLCNCFYNLINIVKFNQHS